MNNYLIIFLCFGLILGGCKTKRAIKKENITKEEKTIRPEKLAKAEILSALERHNFDFEWYEFKGKINADLPTMDGSGTLYLRMKKGEKIWFSAKKFGFEGARGLITPKQATIINRLERTYIQENPEDFVNLLPYPLSFNELQQILSGQILNLSDKDSKIKVVGEMAFITTRVKQNILECTLNLNTMQVESIRAKGEETMQINYYDYKDMGTHGTHPTKIVVNFTQKGRLELKTSKLTIDEEKSMPFNLSSRYKRVKM